MLGAELPNFLGICTVDGSNLYARNGSRCTCMRLRNISAANQANMEGHGNQRIKTLVVRRDKRFVSSFGILRRHNFRRNQHAVAERNTLAGRQRQVQLFLSVAENLFTQRIRREKSVPARVPVSREARIRRMVEN